MVQRADHAKRAADQHEKVGPVQPGGRPRVGQARLPAAPLVGEPYLKDTDATLRAFGTTDGDAQRTFKFYLRLEKEVRRALYPFLTSLPQIKFFVNSSTTTAFRVRVPHAACHLPHATLRVPRAACQLPPACHPTSQGVSEKKAPAWIAEEVEETRGCPKDLCLDARRGLVDHHARLSTRSPPSCSSTSRSTHSS